jgi:hypothetical protein
MTSIKAESGLVRDGETDNSLQQTKTQSITLQASTTANCS